MDGTVTNGATSAATDPGAEFVDLSEQRLDPAIVSLVPDNIARRCRAIPIRRTAGRLVVGMANPGDLAAVDDLRAVLREPFTRVRVSEQQLNDILAQATRLEEEVLSVAQIVADDITEQATDLAGLRSIV